MDVLGNDSRIDGKATLTMVASRNARKAPKQATRRTRDAGIRAGDVDGKPTLPPGERPRAISAVWTRDDAHASRSVGELLSRQRPDGS